MLKMAPTDTTIKVVRHHTDNLQLKNANKDLDAHINQQDHVDDLKHFESEAESFNHWNIRQAYPLNTTDRNIIAKPNNKASKRLTHFEPNARAGCCVVVGARCETTEPSKRHEGMPGPEGRRSKHTGVTDLQSGNSQYSRFQCPTRKTECNSCEKLVSNTGRIFTRGETSPTGTASGALSRRGVGSCVLPPLF